jgi:hypothetical protein
MTSARNRLFKEVAAGGATLLVIASVVLWPTASESASRNSSSRSAISPSVAPKQPLAGRPSTSPPRPSPKSPGTGANAKKKGDGPKGKEKECLAACDARNLRCTQGGPLSSQWPQDTCYNALTSCIGKCRRPT